MAKRRQRYTAEEVATAIRESRGLITYAAKRLGCSRNTVYNYIERYASVAEAQDDARNELLDTAELQLARQINEGNITAIIFTLKTIGKHRGFIERHEHTGAEGGKMEIKVEYENGDDYA